MPPTDPAPSNDVNRGCIQSTTRVSAAGPAGFVWGRSMRPAPRLMGRTRSSFVVTLFVTWSVLVLLKTEHPQIDRVAQACLEEENGTVGPGVVLGGRGRAPNPPNSKSQAVRHPKQTNEQGKSARASSTCKRCAVGVFPFQTVASFARGFYYTILFIQEF